MTFELLRGILMVIGVSADVDIDDFRCIFYSFKPDVIFKAELYGEILPCFNCKVKAFEIDLDAKIMYIKSEVVNHE